MATTRLSAPVHRCEPNLYIFEGQNVRVIAIDDDPWFVGRDVALLLGYEKPADAIRKHCKGVSELETPSPGGPQRTKIIPERDVYRLIMRSKLPAAERFEEWVVGEVLPAIRRTGGYGPSPADDRIERLLTVAETLASALNTALSTAKPRKPYTRRKRPASDPWSPVILEWADAQTEPFRLIEVFPAIAAKHRMDKTVSRLGHARRIAAVLRANGYDCRKMRLRGSPNTEHWEKAHA